MYMVTGESPESVGAARARKVASGEPDADETGGDTIDAGGDGSS